MAFNISDFRSNGLALGGARPSQFEVTLYLKNLSALSASFEGLDKFKFMCRAASVPPSVVEPVQAYYFGRPVQYPGDRVFPPWDVVIYNDEDFILRNLFERWSNRMNQLIGNQMDSAVHPTAYKAGATVTQYGKNGAVIASYTFDGLWPSQVDAMQLGWDATNQIQDFNVQFAYDWWIPENRAINGYANEIGENQGVETQSP